MKQSYKHRRGPATVIGLVLSIAALFAIAAPASAHHRHHHGSSDPAGTISSYDPDSGILTIDLAKGGSISALVTDETRIELNGGCDKGSGDSQGRHARKARAARHDFGGDHGSHHGWSHGQEGSTDDLAPGTVVDDAVLVLADGTAVYAKVELETPPQSSPTT
ncbi:MAG TPA: hypothetical protein VMT37_03180 [Solirubrobacterales bacterium]|nr:hypothetical protein [Solirubrobacterales bacterium]